jgi:hypothetical protein
MLGLSDDSNGLLQNPSPLCTELSTLIRVMRQPPFGHNRAYRSSTRQAKSVLSFEHKRLFFSHETKVQATWLHFELYFSEMRYLNNLSCFSGFNLVDPSGEVDTLFNGLALQPFDVTFHLCLEILECEEV